MNPMRNGRFTSSGIGALMSVAKDKVSFGAPALTYIQEKNYERRLLRSLCNETNAKATSWGKLVEAHVFELLGTEYKLCSHDTVRHAEIEDWAGSPDAEKFDEGKTVVDIKCPYTLKSFCQLADCTTIEQVREQHKEGETYYYQLVSNAILTGAKYAELIVYAPYQSELEVIRELANNYDGDQNAIAFINWAGNSELPWLPDGGYYKNLNIIRFEVPEIDKILLTSKVKEAITKLIPYHIIETATA